MFNASIWVNSSCFIMVYKNIETKEILTSTQEYGKVIKGRTTRLGTEGRLLAYAPPLLFCVFGLIKLVCACDGRVCEKMMTSSVVCACDGLPYCTSLHQLKRGYGDAASWNCGKTIRFEADGDTVLSPLSTYT